MASGEGLRRATGPIWAERGREGSLVDLELTPKQYKLFLQLLNESRGRGDARSVQPATTIPVLEMPRRGSRF
jgi:hypothetical protein